MRNMILGALGALALVGAGVTPAAAQETPTAAGESGGIPPELLEIEKNLHPQTGDITIPAAHAVLHLGDDYYYLPADEAKKVLVDVWGNPPSAVSNVLGLVFEKDATIFDNVWGAVISYDDTGHISDANAEHEDYAAVLREMQKGDAADNAARREAGYPTMNLIGWAQPPSYDKASHALIWAKEFALSDQKVNSLNYDVRLLGRTGTLSLNMVSTMDVLADVGSAAAMFGRAAEFESGWRYADFVAGSDKDAGYGLSGLVAGGAAVAVAQKMGIFALLLKFGKIIIVGLIAFGGAAFAFVRNMFGRKEEDY